MIIQRLTLATSRLDFSCCCLFSSKIIVSILDLLVILFQSLILVQFNPWSVVSLINPWSLFSWILDTCSVQSLINSRYHSPSAQFLEVQFLHFQKYVQIKNAQFYAMSLKFCKMFFRPLRLEEYPMFIPINSFSETLIFQIF